MRLTVNSNSNDLAQDPAIGRLEGRDSLERIELLVFCRETVGRVGLDKLNVEVVLLRNSKEDHGTGIALPSS